MAQTPTTYQTEFPDFVLIVKIPEGFDDVSFKNDGGPSWMNCSLKVHLMIVPELDYPYMLQPLSGDPDDLQVMGYPRWTFQTDNWEEMLKRIVGIDYLQEVGYNPFADDPTMPLESARKILTEIREVREIAGEPERIYFHVIQCPSCDLDHVHELAERIETLFTKCPHCKQVRSSDIIMRKHTVRLVPPEDAVRENAQCVLTALQHLGLDEISLEPLERFFNEKENHSV